MSEPVDAETQATAATTPSVTEASSIAEVPIAKSEPEPQPMEEPQNALTKEFTEQEWSVLKEFRVGRGS